MQNVDQSVGYKWLSERYEVPPVQPFRIRSEIGSLRSTTSDGGFTVETYPAHYRPDESFSANLTFALKYEGVELDFLCRLFQAVGPQPVIEWAQREPTGAYARRCGFFYEWLTGTTLDGVGLGGGNYVDALDSERYLCATNPDKVKRWRVNNNLPGERNFCPMVAVQGLDLDYKNLHEEVEALVTQFGLDTIERAVSWLTVKESRASFVIESEGREEDRIRRFAAALSEHCGKIDSALTNDGMLLIQKAVMGEKKVGIDLGVRRSPVFVGRNSLYEPIIDYLAPHYERIEEMMDGLRAFEVRTRGQNPLLRAAALSFGFVYIHPLSDGNGRLSRFLINDILRRDDVVPAPVILPVSAVISESATRRAAYDAALERLSKPLMARMREKCSFGQTLMYEDGVESNIYVADWDEGLPTWRYPDLTLQSGYLVEIIKHSIRHELKDEATYLMRYDAAHKAIKEIIEARDEDYANIIRSLVANQTISNKLRKTYPTVFENEQLGQRIATLVLRAFELIPDDDDEEIIVPRLDVVPR